MSEVIAAIILIVIGFFCFIVMKSDGSASEKAALIAIIAVVGVIGGAIVGALIMTSPVLALVAIMFVVAVAVGVFQGLFGDRLKNRKDAKASIEFSEARSDSAGDLLKSLAGVKKGDTLRFGRYTWEVLSVENGQALLLTQNAVMKKEYHHDSQARGAEWAKCTLRKFLNRSFLSSTFSPAEQSLIQEHSHDNAQITYSDYSGIKEKNPLTPTQDKVFVLSVDEVKKFLPEKRRLATMAGQSRGYWLRDIFCADAYLVCPTYDGKSTKIEHTPSCLDYGVRPAIWIRVA